MQGSYQEGQEQRRTTNGRAARRGRPAAQRRGFPDRREGFRTACYAAGMAAAAGRSVLGTVFVLVSAGLFVAGWRLTENDRYFLLHASGATGQVVEHELLRR